MDNALQQIPAVTCDYTSDDGEVYWTAVSRENKGYATAIAGLEFQFQYIPHPTKRGYLKLAGCYAVKTKDKDEQEIYFRNGGGFDGMISAYHCDTKGKNPTTQTVQYVYGGIRMNMSASRDEIARYFPGFINWVLVQEDRPTLEREHSFYSLYKK